MKNIFLLVSLLLNTKFYSCIYNNSHYKDFKNPYDTQHDRCYRENSNMKREIIDIKINKRGYKITRLANGVLDFDGDNDLEKRYYLDFHNAKSLDKKLKELITAMMTHRSNGTVVGNFGCFSCIFRGITCMSTRDWERQMYFNRCIEEMRNTIYAKNGFNYFGIVNDIVSFGYLSEYVTYVFDAICNAYQINDDNEKGMIFGHFIFVVCYVKGVRVTKDIPTQEISKICIKLYQKVGKICDKGIMYWFLYCYFDRFKHFGVDGINSIIAKIQLIYNMRRKLRGEGEYTRQCMEDLKSALEIENMEWNIIRSDEVDKIKRIISNIYAQNQNGVDLLGNINLFKLIKPKVQRKKTRRYGGNSKNKLRTVLPNYFGHFLHNAVNSPSNYLYSQPRVLYYDMLSDEVIKMHDNTDLEIDNAAQILLSLKKGDSNQEIGVNEKNLQ